MQVFRELFIRGEPEQLAATAKAICDSISGDWSRDLEAEERVRSKPLLNEGPRYFFKRSKGEHQRAVNLFLLHKNDSTLWVTNIVPLESGQLSIDEYNAVMEEFVELFVKPAVARTGARVELTDAEEDLDDWMSPETAKKLRLFCREGNNSSGSMRLDDRNRWIDFIVSAHREGSDLDSSTLARWLRETGQKNEDRSYELAAEYAFARELLAQAEKQSVGV